MISWSSSVYSHLSVYLCVCWGNENSNCLADSCQNCPCAQFCVFYLLTVKWLQCLVISFTFRHKQRCPVLWALRLLPHTQQTNPFVSWSDSRIQSVTYLLWLLTGGPCFPLQHGNILTLQLLFYNPLTTASYSAAASQESHPYSAYQVQSFTAACKLILHPNSNSNWRHLWPLARLRVEYHRGLTKAWATDSTLL